jgi:putative Mn2+ efflux pump MntP
LLIALALSIDNVTIAVAAGAQARKPTLGKTIRLPAIFGTFAALAMATGWFAGSQMAPVLTRYGTVAAGAILLYVGWRTLRSAWQSVNGGADVSSLPAALIIGLGTSVDSLTVGFAMALAHAGVAALAILNGAICFGLSLAGFVGGQRIGHMFPFQSKIAAGILLIAVGVRALLQHS